MNFIIVHGSYGSPKKNWFPWLKSELNKLNHKVFVPKFPTPRGQKLGIWLKVLKDYDKYLDGNSVMVGHSTGGTLILRKLELLDKPIKAIFLVGGYTKDLWNGGYSIAETFINKPFKWGKIKQNVEHIEIYQSDNDPYIPVSMGKEMARNLDGELIIVRNAVHFNTKAGYTKFPLLLENIKVVAGA